MTSTRPPYDHDTTPTRLPNDSMDRLRHLPEGAVTRQVAELERRVRVLDRLAEEILATLDSPQNQQRLIEASEKAVEALREHISRWWLIYASAGGFGFHERPPADHPPATKKGSG